MKIKHKAIEAIVICIVTLLTASAMAWFSIILFNSQTQHSLMAGTVCLILTGIVILLGLKTLTKTF